MEMTPEEIANKVLSSNEGLKAFSSYWLNKELYDVPVSKAIEVLKKYIYGRINGYVNACMFYNGMDMNGLYIELSPALL